jgi:hypothetical protein
MGKTPTGSICRVILIGLLAVARTVPAAEEPKEVQSPPVSVRTALGCLVARDYITAALANLKLGPGRSAWVRYFVGTVPGWTPTPGEFYIAVYSEDGRHGWLLISFRERGKFVAVRNGYRLTKVGSRWNADEGNGGLATYKAMSQFATNLEKSPRYRVKLAPRTQGCAAPDE